MALPDFFRAFVFAATCTHMMLTTKKVERHTKHVPVIATGLTQ